MAIYSGTSPYYQTGMYGKFLDIMINRPISRLKTDRSYTIESLYNLRPDLLAYDLYTDAKLWWVFAARNPDVLSSPLFDFVTGVTIYVPTLVTLKHDLNI